MRVSKRDRERITFAAVYGIIYHSHAGGRSDRRSGRGRKDPLIACLAVEDQEPAQQRDFPNTEIYILNPQ